MTGSISEWGKRHGISKQAAWKRVRGHNIPVENGRIDFEQADAIWNRSKNVLQIQRGTGSVPESKPESPAATTPVSMSHLAHTQLKREELRLEKEQLQIEQLRMELQKARAEIVPVDELKAAFAQLITYTREQLLAMPSQLRDRLAAAKDPNACERMLEDRVVQALINLSNFRLSATA